MSHKIKKEKLLKVISMNKKICLMGIGNFDRADDYSGIAIIENLERKKFTENIKIINAGPVPEAFTGVIKDFKPDILVVVDAAKMDEKPGTIRVFTEKDIDDAYMVTPHQVSMTMYMKYLKHYLKDLSGIFIGIEPLSLEYMEEMSAEVKGSVEYVSEYLIDLLQKHG